MSRGPSNGCAGSCHVIAPALIPRKPGDRSKTDRRDARKLAELHRAGVLTDVRHPTPREEAVRDLARARDDARDDLQRGRQRLGKFLLRRGLHYAGKNWTRGHRAWVAGLSWEHEAEQPVVDDYLLAIDHLDTRLDELDAHLAERAESEPYRAAVGALRCFHGIDTLTAMLILAELHDFRRVPSPRALMAYLGLVPSEASSGERHRRGRITKTGNTLVRRLLVEAAWHYRHRARVGDPVGAPASGATRGDDPRRRQSPAAPLSTLPATGRAAEPSWSSRAGDGLRGRRMIRGTDPRTGGFVMRYGPRVPTRAYKKARPRDETRSCVLCGTVGAVTTEYQCDSSSKRPQSSVVFAARRPQHAVTEKIGT